MPESIVPGPATPASPTHPDPAPLVPRAGRTLRGRTVGGRALGGQAPEDSATSGPQAGSGSPGAGRPGFGPPGSARSEAARPGSARSGSARSGSARSATARSGSAQSGSAQSGSARPATARPRSRRRPLPDAQAICSFGVPEIAPPYDDTAATRNPARPTARRRLASVSSAGGYPARSGRPIQQLPSPSLGLQAAGTWPPSPQPQETQPHGAQPRGTQPQRARPPTEPPGTGAWPSQFAQVLAETLAGSRPASQMVPWTTEQTRRRISKLGPVLAAAHRPRVRRVIVTSPASGVLEMTVILALGAHGRAGAVRLERARPGRTGDPPDRDQDRVPPRGQPTASARTATLRPTPTPTPTPTPSSA